MPPTHTLLRYLDEPWQGGMSGFKTLQWNASDAGLMGRPCGRCDLDDGDLAGCPLLVVVVLRPDIRHQPPQGWPVFPDGWFGAGANLVGADLNPNLRVREKVAIPVRVLVGTAVGGDHDVAVAVVAVYECCPSEPSGSPSTRCKEERVHSLPAVAASSGALDIGMYVPGNPTPGAVVDLLVGLRRRGVGHSGALILHTNRSSVWDTDVCDHDRNGRRPWSETVAGALSAERDR